MGVRERPIDRRVEQAEQQRRIHDYIRGLERRLQRDAARLGFAGAVRQHAGQHVGEMEPLVRLAHATRREAGQLLADHADLARLLDLVAQRAQPGPVDAPRRDEGMDALQRRRQRTGDFGADFRNQLVPALVFV